MKKNVMKKLVKALRSGDYAQAKGSLVKIDEHGNESFCCLGVLCDLATQAGEGEWNERYFEDERGHICSAYLPEGIVKWAGMKSQGGILPGNYSSLMTLNDNGKSFAEIADIIEAKYKDL